MLYVHVFSFFVEKLTVELDAIPREIEDMDWEIARAEIFSAQRLVERLRSAVQVQGRPPKKCSAPLRGNYAPPPPPRHLPSLTTLRFFASGKFLP